MPQTEILSSLEWMRAAELLKKGQLICFPTETVYGLGACIFNEIAIESIFKVKGRPADNPLIAHVSSVEQVSLIAEEIPDIFYWLAKRFFPGPLTVILKRRSSVPSIVSAGLETIAVRMPSHPVALKLIEAVGEPLVAPSANLSGKPSATNLKAVLEDFEGKIAAAIDGGNTEFGIESTVLNLRGDIPIIMRPGAIPREVLEDFLNCSISLASKEDPGEVSSPGMKYRHYSPHVSVQVVYTLPELHKYLETHSHLGKIFLLGPSGPLDLSLYTELSIDQFLLRAQDFYSHLRLADEKKYEKILILCDEHVQKDEALMNRLICAAGLMKT